MTLTGDFSELNDAVVRLQSLDGLTARAAQRAANSIAGVVDEQFAAGTDPYGTPWQDLASGGPSHLTETGEMHAGVVVHASGSDIVITVPDPGGYHQTGTRYMPARPVEPVQSQGLPPAYEIAILAAVAEEAA
jgi:hypothetical protein